jgi:hypothetical protein
VIVSAACASGPGPSLSGVMVDIRLEIRAIGAGASEDPSPSPVRPGLAPPQEATARVLGSAEPLVASQAARKDPCEPAQLTGASQPGDPLIALGRNTAAGRQHLASIGRRSKFVGASAGTGKNLVGKRKRQPLTGIDSDDSAVDEQRGHNHMRARRRRPVLLDSSPPQFSKNFPNPVAGINSEDVPRTQSASLSRSLRARNRTGVSSAPVRDNMQLEIRPHRNIQKVGDSSPKRNRPVRSTTKSTSKKPTLTGWNTVTDGEDSVFVPELKKQHGRRRQQQVEESKLGKTTITGARERLRSQTTLKHDSSDSDLEVSSAARSSRVPRNSASPASRKADDVRLRSEAKEAIDHDVPIPRLVSNQLKAFDLETGCRRTRSEFREHTQTQLPAKGVGGICGGLSERRDAHILNKTRSNSSLSPMGVTRARSRTESIMKVDDDDDDDDSDFESHPLRKSPKLVRASLKKAASPKFNRRTLEPTRKSARLLTSNSPKKASAAKASSGNSDLRTFEEMDDSTPRGTQPLSQIDLTDALQAIPQKAKKPRSLLGRAREAILRERMSDDELGRIRIAFCALYPPPPSNMAAQGRYEAKYGREMTKDLEKALWLKELKPWSDRWWELYQLFNDDVRARKMLKDLDRTTTVTDIECSKWASQFHEIHGNARVTIGTSDGKHTPGTLNVIPETRTGTERPIGSDIEDDSNVVHRVSQVDSSRRDMEVDVPPDSQECTQKRSGCDPDASSEQESCVYSLSLSLKHENIEGSRNHVFIERGRAAPSDEVLAASDVLVPQAKASPPVVSSLTCDNRSNGELYVGSERLISSDPSRNVVELMEYSTETGELSVRGKGDDEYNEAVDSPLALSQNRKAGDRELNYEIEDEGAA